MTTKERISPEQVLADMIAARYGVKPPDISALPMTVRRRAVTEFSDRLAAVGEGFVELHHTGESRAAVRRRFARMSRRIDLHNLQADTEESS